QKEYEAARSTLEWYDIIVMGRVPDDIPRLSGVINANHTTPLSHTNVLAHGWQIPNCVQLGILQEIEERGLDGQWVSYSVEGTATAAQLETVEQPPERELRRPA